MNFSHQERRPSAKLGCAGDGNSLPCEGGLRRLTGVKGEGALLLGRDWATELGKEKKGPSCCPRRPEREFTLESTWLRAGCRGQEAEALS